MPTDKDITIYDIAKKLKVSPATVSRGLKDHPAISKKTKKKIVALADEIGYRSNPFARNLRSQKTDTIGVLVPRLNSHFMSSVIAGIEEVANGHGYTLLIGQSSESEAKEKVSAKTMFNSRVDGLLASLAYDTNNLAHFESFFKKHLPVVFFDRVMEHERCTNVLIHNRKAAYNATKHLIEQGCKRIAHITALQRQNVYVDRLQGYKQALEEAGLPFKEEYVIVNNLSIDAGAEAAAQLLAMKERPDAVFVANDSCAVGCLLAMKAAGIRIPENVAFVGFNNDAMSRVVEPNLTTVNYPGYEMGQVAARQLVNDLKGTSPTGNTTSIVLRSELVVRASSLKKRANV